MSRARLAALPVLVAAALVAAAPPAAAAPADTGRYYVVGDDSDYLFGIAARTLGDGRRFRELYELNRGRPQPGGETLDDPAVLRAGWVLALPADATGPQVRTGPLPAVPPVVPAAARPAPERDGFPGPAVGGSVLLIAAAITLLAVLGRNRRRPAVTPPPAGPTTELPVLTGPDGAQPDVVARVGSGDDHLDVRLTRPDDGPATPAYAWLPPGRELPADARMPVVLGSAGRWRLGVDLTRVPEVLTLGGPAELRVRQALAIGEQVRDAGGRVGVVRGALGDAVPADWESWPDYPDADPRAARPTLVISGGLRGADLRAARRLAEQSGRWAVPMLVGDVVRARWSIVVREGAQSTGPRISASERSA